MDQCSAEEMMGTHLNATTMDVRIANIQPMIPPSCNFPFLFEQSPQNLIVCLIYIFGSGGIITALFYLWLRERQRRLALENGHKDDRSTPKGTPGDQEVLSRMFSRRSDS